MATRLDHYARQDLSEVEAQRGVDALGRIERSSGMIGRLIRPDGTVEREWRTSRPDLAMTADRNYPAGWRVEIVA